MNGGVRLSFTQIKSKSAPGDSLADPHAAGSGARVIMRRCLARPVTRSLPLASTRHFKLNRSASDLDNAGPRPLKANDGETVPGRADGGGGEPQPGSLSLSPAASR